MELFFQLVVDGLASGAIYASLALALVLIFRATRIVNFGQGEMATFSAYCAWQLCEWGMPMLLSFLVVGALAFLLGIGVFRFVIRPVSKAPVEAAVVVTLGLFVVFQALSLWLWGCRSACLPFDVPECRLGSPWRARDGQRGRHRCSFCSVSPSPHGCDLSLHKAWPCHASLRL